MEKIPPEYGKSMSTNFPASSHATSFVAFSRTMRNWWGNPCISHMMKYTIGWESNGKKALILWEKYEYQFSRVSHGFCCIFPYCGKFMGKPCISHMLKYNIGWESDRKKAPILWEKYEYQFPRLFPYHGFYCILSYCGKFTGKPMHFPYDDIG